jgi:hypothetical protein
MRQVLAMQRQVMAEENHELLISFLDMEVDHAWNF